jgi:hypothetical protein
VKLVVFRRCILESRLGADECAERLRRVTRRVRIPLVRRPLVGRASSEAFSVRWVRSRTLLMPRATGTFTQVSGPATEIRVELGVSVIELVVVLFFTALYLFGAVDPDHNSTSLILGAMFLVWIGVFAVVLLRWSRGADRLLQIISVTCEATARQQA